MPTFQDRNAELQPVIALFNRLEDLSAWKRNARGNLTRSWGDNRLTIFYRNGRFRFSIFSPGDETRFSPCDYCTEADAIAAVAEDLLWEYTV